MTPIKVWAVLRDGKIDSLYTNEHEATEHKLYMMTRSLLPAKWTIQPGTFVPEGE